MKRTKKQIEAKLRKMYREAEAFWKTSQGNPWQSGHEAGQMNTCLELARFLGIKLDDK